jgi:DNA-binding response OmpR family regulator
MIARPSNLPQVFVVDANKNDYLDLQSSMADGGYRVRLCANGRAALRVEAEEAPEMWIVNINLPDMTGPDLISMLRWRYPKTPICLVSDDYSVEDEISARSTGAELYLCKPIQPEWLILATPKSQQ